MPSLSCAVEEAIPPGLRLDRYIAEYLKVLSRSQIKARDLKARLDGKAVKVSRVLKGGERLELSWTEAEAPFLVPEDIPLELIYEDTRVIVINKAQGMIVHPGAGNRRNTLANALLYRRLERSGGKALVSGGSAAPLGSLTDAGGSFPSGAEAPLPFTGDASRAASGLRPGIVHRLDKDTSGVLIAAWDDEALAFLSEQFKARKVRKIYAALVHGCPPAPSGSIDKPIIRSPRDRKTFTVSDKGGRPSLTGFRLVRSWGNYSLLLLRPKTGRTHQIRVHLKYLGNPILGDPLYGRASPLFPSASLMLHAKSLSLVLPGGENPRTFRTHLPARFGEIIRVLERTRR